MFVLVNQVNLILKKKATNLKIPKNKDILVSIVKLQSILVKHCIHANFQPTVQI